jgi:hypothetical protein
MLRRLRLRRLASLLLLAAATGACEQPPVASRRAASPPPASQAMRAYRDPVTGLFGEPPPAAAPVATPRARAVLTEEAAPGGGRMIRLHGAYRSEMVANGPGVTASCASTSR